MITWTLTALSMIGVVLNARKKVSGFWFWAVANAGWVAVNCTLGQYAQAVLFGFYFVACIYGIWVWRRGTVRRARTWEGSRVDRC